MDYLITGGTGFIGSAFLKHHVSNNDFITLLSRKNRTSAPRCRFVKDLSCLKDTENIDCIINLAGKPIDCLWTKNNKKSLLNSRMSTTSSLVDLVKRLAIKPRVMISASAVGFYGGHNKQQIDECSEGEASFTHELCQQWENEALKMEKYGVRVCIMRLGVVLGPQGGFIKKVALPFKLGLGGKIGTGEQFFPWIHIDDVLSIMQLMIQNNNYSGVYNVVAPEIITQEKIARCIANRVKRPMLLNMPSVLIQTLFGEMGNSLLLTGNQIIPKRLTEQGYAFKYSAIKPAIEAIFSKFES